MSNPHQGESNHGACSGRKAHLEDGSKAFEIDNTNKISLYLRVSMF